MKLSELRPVLYSTTGNVLFCIIYDCNTNSDIEYGCSIEYAYKHYGNRAVKSITAAFEKGQSYIVISLL